MPVREATARLDVIADTFLSVSTPLQLALASLLEVRKQMRPQILDRLGKNISTLDEFLSGQRLITRLPVQAGWYVSLRLPAHEPSEASALRLLEATGVYVHPGDFFGYSTPGIWVLSLLTPESTFHGAIPRLIKHIQDFE
jgi:aspartate/methionine/tyrosine aminotransferase